MTLAYFDCFAGAAGDMLVASLLDAGADFDALTMQINSLDLPGVSIRREPVQRGGIAGTHFNVDIGPTTQPHRHLPDILAIIDSANIAPRAAERARTVFQTLAAAEAEVHQTTIEYVHFHEVGAADSIVDIIGTCIAMELLGIDRIIAGTLTLGNGTVKCDHGILPVPAPATAKLVEDVPVQAGIIPFEATTPTGAAVLVALAESFGPLPPMTVASVGHGAGTRDDGPVANILRVFIGEPVDASGDADTVLELAVNLDDCTGEILGATQDLLLQAGAMDVWTTPITMKKSRPAHQLTVLCHPADQARMEELLFTETTTLGIRRRTLQRRTLQRMLQTVETPFGDIRIKIATLAGDPVSAKPEFEDCLVAARSHHVSVQTVQQAARAAYAHAQARVEP
jgi:pyridinium-3,5-bisthiocarboxylic acid mononucleotide nickel chelatase